jgi:hypothetical protein
VPVHFAYAAESDPGPYPIRLTRRSRAVRRPGGDRYVLVVQPGTCRLYELFDAHRNGGGRQPGSGAVYALDVDAAAGPGRASASRSGGAGAAEGHGAIVGLALAVPIAAGPTLLVLAALALIALARTTAPANGRAGRDARPRRVHARL